MASTSWRRTTTVAVISIGGVAGALARYGVARALPDGGGFPWSTFTVNVSGSVAIGVLLTVVSLRYPSARNVRLLLGTGVLGAYTTFSTLTVDAGTLVRGHHAAMAAWYVVSSLAAGLTAVSAAVGFTRLTLRRGAHA